MTQERFYDLGTIGFPALHGGGTVYEPQPNFSIQLLAVELYLDDSQTSNKGGVACFAGYACETSEIVNFLHPWLAQARSSNLPGDYLHTSDFLSAKNARYAAMNLAMAERVSVIRSLLEVVHDFIPLGVGVTVDVEALREVDKKINPHVFCLVRALRLARYNSNVFKNPVAPITVICDHGPAASSMLKAFQRLKRDVEEVDVGLTSIGFADDRFYFPLQAADMFACLLAREERQQITNAPQAYGSLFEILNSSRKQTAVTHYAVDRWSREEVLENAEHIRAGMRRLYL